MGDRRSDRRDRRDTGFTLTEILIAVSILGVLTSALGAAIIVGMNTIDSTRQQYVSSNARNLASQTIVEDIQAATADPTPVTTPASCPTQPGSVDLFVVHRYVWTTKAEARTVTYRLASDGSRCDLQRELTDDSGTVRDTHALVRGVRTQSSAQVSIVGETTALQLALPGDALDLVKGIDVKSFKVSASPRVELP